MSVKDDLYSILNDFGKETLQIEFQNNINSSIPKIQEILSKTIERKYKQKYSNTNQNYNYNEKPLSLLCEAFLHFLLTATSLPSQRKVMLKDIEIDLVIPDLKYLNKDPNKSLIIKFDRGTSIKHYIDKLHNTISINKENIWIISVNPLNIDYRNYVIYKIIKTKIKISLLIITILIKFLIREMKKVTELLIIICRRLIQM